MTERLDRMEKMLEWLLKSQEESWKKFDKQMKESWERFDKQMKKIQEETKRMQKETKEMKKTLIWMWVTQWDISENLIYDNFWNVFKGIWEEINTINRNVKLYNKWRIRWEFDIVWINGTKIFIWETKTKLTKDHIDKLITKTIPIFRKYDKKHEWMEIYGVIWARVIPEKVLKYACDKWLYVLKEKNNGNAEMVEKSLKTVKSL